ncbi:MAG: hypothetical protein J7K21_06075 [Desulfurococcales archaeon]|nr:hypothetical protein [Desulfurococcales archaeon]
MSGAVVIAVLDREGRIIDYVAPMNIGFSIIKESIQVGYDIYRTIEFITKNLGFKVPKNITVNYMDQEITVIPRRNSIIVSITLPPTQVVSGPGKATVEA